MDCKTKTGLLLLIIGSILAILSNITFYIAGPTAIALSVIGAIGGLISLIGAIIYILGRKEFGEKHSKFVIYATIIFILSIVITIVIVGVVVAAAASAFVSGSTDLSFLKSIFYIIPFASILGGIAYIFFLYELEDKLGRIVLLLAIIVSVISYLFIAINISSTFDETIGTFNFENASSEEILAATTELTEKISGTSIFSVINGVLILIALYIPYRRITSGELVPVVTDIKSGEPDRKCPNCSRTIPFDAKICPYCSKRFEDFL
jgi:hypothetical protein